MYQSENLSWMIPKQKEYRISGSTVITANPQSTSTFKNSQI